MGSGIPSISLSYIEFYKIAFDRERSAKPFKHLAVVFSPLNFTVRLEGVIGTQRTKWPQDKHEAKATSGR